MLKRNLTFLLMAGLALGMLIAVTSSSLVAAQQSQQIDIVVLWSGTELQAFNDVVTQFENANPAIKVTVDSVGRDEPAVLVSRIKAGNPPDLAAMPNPGQLKQFVAGIVKPGTSDVVPMDFMAQSIEQNDPKAFVDLGTIKGPDGQDHLYGIFLSADLKGLIWYNPDALYVAGLAPADSWDELFLDTHELADEFGKTPWSIGLESGAASGWPGTDWIEDFMLRTAGPDVYDQWVNHEILWTDPRVKHAWELFGAIARNPKYVNGGPQAELSTNFGDAANCLFTNPPGCYFHHQATFMQSFITTANPKLQPVNDFNFFIMPPVDPSLGNPLEGAGDLIAMLKDSPAAETFATYLASAPAQQLWVKELQKLPINKNVDLSVLNPLAQRAAKLLSTATALRFDASDQMPSQVQDAFYKGILNYVNGADLCTQLQAIEQAAEAAYGNTPSGESACP